MVPGDDLVLYIAEVLRKLEAHAHAHAADEPVAPVAATDQAQHRQNGEELEGLFHQRRLDGIAPRADEGLGREQAQQGVRGIVELAGDPAGNEQAARERQHH